MEYIIGVILLMLLFALPDALRHKRRYPHRGKRRSSPMDTTKPGQRTKQGPAPERAPQQGTAKRRVPEKPRTARPAKGAPVPEDTGRTGQVSRPAAAAIGTVPEPASVPTAPAVVYSYIQPPAWSGLSGEARDIYAGLVWSELLQKPVSLRDRK
ncbi:hypothetical protein [uncultured Megasphaera sp.]|jgi:hypothetical protein|uniref:hypothetical protein n=1 Tax=uncultured Megasphaera sp. TaxID=165188 RepID=UPI0025F50C87|nr:hypothetical protein [uncultured Megasphaera sp.]